jgi:hypothetical protein
LKLIDPYFTRGEPNRLHRWKATCGEFLRIAFSGRAPKSQVEHPVEYHTLADGKVSGERFQARLEQDLKLQEFIPRGKRLVVVRWYPLKDGELFHARYVLTERGGLRYDAGLDENAKRQETDLSLVGRENLQKIRDNLKPSTGAYRYCDTTHVENGMVRTFQDDAMKPKAYK